MAGVKTYGPAPAPEAKELLLAKMLQNAWSRDLGWCKGQRYSTATGGWAMKEYAANCCAMGAADLETDSSVEARYLSGIVTGNDSPSENWDIYAENTHSDLGYAFRQAMTVEEDAEVLL